MLKDHNNRISILLIGFFLSLAMITSCDGDSLTMASETDTQSSKTAEVSKIDGQMNIVMQMAGFDINKGISMINTNYLIAEGVAYQLVLVEDTVLKLENSSDNEAITVPAPANLGRVVFRPGAYYRTVGQIKTTKRKIDNLPIKELRVQYLEFLRPTPKDSGVTMAF